MILTINLNAALDWVYFIERFIPSTHMRPHKAVLSVGGKGLDTALVLQTLGAPHHAITFLAGKNGEMLVNLLEQKHIPTEFIWLPGETRVSNVIVETDLNRHSHITTQGYSVNRQDCDNFLAKIEVFAPQAKWAVIAGSMPPGTPVNFYGEIIEQLHRHNVKVLIDGFGPSMHAALPAKPEIVKMNRAEFDETFQIQIKGLDELVRACQDYTKRFQIKSLVITCGKDGILAVTPEGTYQAGCIEVKEINAAGAGDAVSAALVYRFLLGDSWTQALSWAVATSAAVVMTEGTAECFYPDIMEIYPHAWVKELQ